MKKLFKKLQAIDRKIKEIKSETETLKESPFYSLFKKEGQREIDLNNLKERHDGLVDRKAKILRKVSTVALRKALIIEDPELLQP